MVHQTMKINNASATSASISNSHMTTPISHMNGRRIVALASMFVALGLGACAAPPAVRQDGSGAPSQPAPPAGTSGGNGAAAVANDDRGADAPDVTATNGAAPGTTAPPAVTNTPNVARPAADAPVALSPALRAATFRELPGWADDDIAQAWPAFLTGCTTLRNRAEWRAVCDDALRVDTKSRWAMRKFFVDRFQPYRVQPIDGPAQGLLTGYYEPLLRGSRTRHADYQVPLFSPPDDLVTLDLASFVPDAPAAQRLRGRVVSNADGKRAFVPYYSRAELLNGAGAASLRGKEIAWVNDPIEAFFLQVQGSGRVQLDDGSVVRLGYADTNGHPYRSIGRWLIDRGELRADEASMQTIQAWARAHPERLNELLTQNPSFVFFRETTGNDLGPLGSLGVPLTAERSIAVDPKHVPMGAPVWLSSTRPLSTQPLRRLVFAQDTGGAIVGSARADLYWGSGAQAGELAGRTRQRLDLWVLLPRR